ncbi:hypothetical protein PR003_g23296 [Phytophthora rubi]|uniref:Uncharacterized protein n=1 Tax=Phytophthora rubi TaxID=129364 RepID=A0A6A4D0S4_9STRA|nr:hypothetical protein PR002_g15607 [Phytophthora rubi]KAE9014833.1 hypothetical protein PR001_g15036 [Phytophthora rubi]KAE9298229.1 hypothetical protein PR003_g23296 [Phytophthora rubi]
MWARRACLQVPSSLLSGGACQGVQSTCVGEGHFNFEVTPGIQIDIWTASGLRGVRDLCTNS